MNIEYRSRDGGVKHTYRNVTNLKRDTGDTVHLFGTELDNTVPITHSAPLGIGTREFFIAAIHLAEGESLENVDVYTT